MKRLRPAELMSTTHSQITRNGRISRAIAVVAVGILGSIAITHTAAYQMSSQDAGLAHGLAPYDGRITALAAAYRSGPQATSADRIAGDALARLALRQDPTAVVAASTIGLNAQVRDKLPEARRLFAYASFLSRREMQTQLWAIEDSVGRGSVVDALQHYDIVMRSNPILSQMLFPTLTAASTDPEIRFPLIKTLAARPPWGPSFVAYVAANTPEPKSTALLLSALHGAGVAVPDDARADLIKSLMSAGFVEDAWNYYASVHPGTDRRRSRDPRFKAAMDSPSQFDWSISTGEGVNASIQRGSNNGILEFTAPPMVGAAVAQQVQLLPAGYYRLRGHSLGVEQNTGEGPYWSLSCQGGQEIGRVNVPRSDQADGRFSGTFNVPRGCPIQILMLVTRPSENIAGLFGQIDFVQLEPAP